MWKDECKKEASELTQEKRQQFLDLMWNGKSIKEAYEISEISFNAANGIMMQNIDNCLYLRKEAR